MADARLHKAVKLIGETKTRLQEELKIVRWAGVFGSYARNARREHSDIDFLIGFRDGTLWDDVYQAVYTVSHTLSEAMEKEVDVLYMRNMEIKGSVMLDALLHAKTVYGDDAWLLANRPPGVKYLEHGYEKLQMALALEREILHKMDAVNTKSILLPKNAAVKLDLIHLLEKLCAALSFEPDHPFGSYFWLVSDWILDQRDLVERVRNPESDEAETKDFEKLWGILDRELDNNKVYLEEIYMPVAMEARIRALEQSES